MDRFARLEGQVDREHPTGVAGNQPGSADSPYRCSLAVPVERVDCKPKPGDELQIARWTAGTTTGGDTTMESVLAVVLAGGKGSRLEPLTRDRAKPAVPFGGAYRIIDFTLSNCLNSGLRKILVLTQYKAA